MPICKNNDKRSYTGKKRLGYCASGEKEGTKMKGLDGNIWQKKNGKWVKYSKNSENSVLLEKKLYNWWKNLSQGGIIIIYKDLTNQMKKKSQNYNGNY
jgi:hypothetical protein